MKAKLSIAVVVAVWLLVWPSASAARSPSDADVKLVVILASGWNTSTTNGGLKAWEDDWQEMRSALDGLDDLDAVVVRPFSYVPNAEAYDSCDTNQAIAQSSLALTTQSIDLLSQYQNARLLVVGHSLGGVVATHWSVTLRELGADSSMAKRLLRSEIVTLDSPVRGLNLTALDRVLFKGLGRTVIKLINCGSQIPDDLNVTIDPWQVGSQVPTLKKAADYENYHTGTSATDLFIHRPTALLSKSDSRTFFSGAHCVPAMNATALLAISRGRYDDETFKKIVDCIADTHGAVLRDPAAIEWVRDIGKTQLDAATQETTTATPRPSPPAEPTKTPTSTAVTTFASVEQALRAGARVPTDYSLSLDEGIPGSPCRMKCATALSLSADGPTVLFQVFVDARSYRVAVTQSASRWSVAWSAEGQTSTPESPPAPGALLAGGAKDDATAVRLCAEAVRAVPGGVLIHMAFFNQTASGVPWTSDVGDSRIYVEDDRGTRYRSVAVGGRFAADFPTFPPGKVWYGWHRFEVPATWSSLTLNYPGRGPMKLARLPSGAEIHGGCENW